MIEKLAKQIKRNNKKRNLNTTIATIVGFLLSCTTAMGVPEIGKEITNIENQDYDFINDENISISDSSEDTIGLYINFSKIKDIINNGDIHSSVITPASAYGIKLSNVIAEDIVNNGRIESYVMNATPASATAYGIELSNVAAEDIVNNGHIESSVINAIPASVYGIKLSNVTAEDIVNNGYIRLSSSKNILNTYADNRFNSNTIAYGIALSNTAAEDVINNGTIYSLESEGSKGAVGIGAYENVTLNNLVNNGIVGVGSREISYSIIGSGIVLDNIINNGALVNAGAKETRGIFLEKSTVKKDIVNNGYLLASHSDVETAGIYLRDTSIGGDIKNNGKINAFSGFGNTFGIHILHDSEINIINTGDIFSYSGSSSGKGYGIFSNHIPNINNLGYIGGYSSAVSAVNGNKVNNYGILTSAENLVVDGGNSTNYGLYISDINYYSGIQGLGIVSIDESKQSTKPIEITIGHDESGNEKKRAMTIKNAVIEAGGHSTESFVISKGTNKYDNSILNGKDETLKVSGSGEIKGSIINAYGTAVKFDATGGKLTLSGTVVNGGRIHYQDPDFGSIDSAIMGSSNGDTLILQSGEIKYTDGSIGIQNTIVNGYIHMGDGDDTLTVENGTIINGVIDGGYGEDTLNFVSNSKINTNSKTGNEINIIHGMTRFENINVNTNVTLFEKTGTMNPIRIVGTKKIKIGTDGVLTLRLDSFNTDSTGKIVGHALYENDGIIYSTDGGKLLLALNGAGNEDIISFGNTHLDNSLVTDHEAIHREKVTLGTTSLLHSVKRIEGTTNEVIVTAKLNLPASNPDDIKYEKLNEIYQSIISVDELGNFDVDNDEKLSTFLGYLNDIYAGNPYSFSSELSRKSMGMFRDIVVENIFRPETNKWMIHGGLTHIDGGTKDTYYGKGYYTYDVGSSDMEADTKITGAYMLGEYGISDTLTSGMIIGGNKLKSDLSNSSKVDGSAMYIGGYVKKYAGNLKVTAGAGFQYGDYNADRLAVNRVASSIAEPVVKYSDNYNDMAYDIYLSGRYSNPMGDNLFLEPYGTLSYTYIKQDGADEGSKTLAIETDSKSFDYTAAKVGVDFKKVISHEKGKSTLSAGVSYTKIINGADEKHITGRFKSGKDFDILVAHKNEHSIGLNAKYALELENGILFDVKGSYAVERDLNNNSGKNKTKGEWIVGVGLGYKF